MVAVQSRLLAAAARMLAPGGTLVFCTCSLQPDEGPARIAALLSTNTGLSRAPISADEVGGIAEFVTPQGDIRTLPHQMGGIDGFYICRLRAAGQTDT
jgi:16S rRNA (cytosine967-C5)-methyltransferase